MTRIPHDAFERYLAMGAERSYRLLAKELGCSKRSVYQRAQRDSWQRQLAEFEEKARTKAAEKLSEDLSSLHERHLRTIRALQAKALEVLRARPLESAEGAAKTLLMAMREERQLFEEPSRRGGTTVSVTRAVREIVEKRTVALADSAPPQGHPEILAASSTPPRVGA